MNRILISLGLALVACRATAPGHDPDLLSDPEREAVDALAEALLDEHLSTAFVVGVLREGGTWVRGYGALADGATPDGSTLFEIGSISKVFTGLLLADAHLRGEVDLDDELARFAPPGVAVPEHDGGPIRLRHLATHSSGLLRMPPGYQPPSAEDPFAGMDAAAIWAAVERSKLRRAPEERYAYSNFGAGLLGQIVGGATEAGYDARLVERVCDPLGLDDTRLVTTEERAARMAQGYDLATRPTSPWHFEVLGGAGGIVSNVDDMLRFARANVELDDPQLGPALALAQTEHYAAGDDGPVVGLGWHLGQDGVTRWHNGQTGGYHAMLLVHPEQDVAVVCLSACSHGHVELLAMQLYQRLLGKEPEGFDLRRSADVPREVLARYVGSYSVAFAGTLEVELDERGLVARIEDQPWVRIWPESETEFFYRVVEATLVFKLEDGVASAVTLHQDGMKLPGARTAD